jgi:DNA invertase Pin-like site-specific DNA recombinase
MLRSKVDTPWLTKDDLSLDDISVYAKQASGADRNRDAFHTLIEDIKADEFDAVVVWEVSRIARRGLDAQRFFETCEAQDVVIHVVNGAVRRIEPNGTGRLVADIIASVSAEERRRLIRRTKSGLNTAKKQGKWLGNVPTGFVRVDGYLKPNLNPEYDNGETGYLDVAEALERIESGDSYRSVARETPNLTRQGLMDIHKNDRRDWYLEQEAEDERVEMALDTVTESG